MPARRAAGGLEWFAVAAVLAVAAAVSLDFERATRDFTLDDAFITFRYAENLALGKGFVYNAGERVLGITTPLLGLLLGALGRVCGAERIPTCASTLLLTATLAMGLFVYRIFRHAGRPASVALLGLGLVMLHPDVVWVTAGGMETPLVLLFMAASLYSLQRGQWTRVGIALGFLLLTRPDGVLWSALVLGSAWGRDRKSAWRTLPACSAVLAPWILFATFYYGSPVPHSIVAKLAIPLHAANSALTASTLSGYGQLLLQHTGIEMRGRVFSMEFFEYVVWTCLLLAGVWEALRRGSANPFLVPLVFVPLFWIGLALSGLEAPFPWYPVPATWACLLLVAYGLAALGSVGFRATQHSIGKRVLALVLSLGILGVLADRLDEDSVSSRREYRAVQEHTEAVNQAIGLWLAAQAPPGSSIAMEAIGYQGYFSRCRVIDLAGLVSPEVVRLARQSVTHGELYFRVLSQLQPDFVVLRAFEIEEGVSFFGGSLFDSPAEREYFDGNYRLASRFSHPHPWPRVSAVEVWMRKAPAPSHRPGSSP